MVKLRVICDICERPLPEDEGGVIYTHRTKEWDTRTLFPCLCESCASKVDMALSMMKKGETYRRIIMERNTKLNAERREKLNTKG